LAKLHVYSGNVGNLLVLDQDNTIFNRPVHKTLDALDGLVSLDADCVLPACGEW
jgi:hypothetical protein